MRSVAVSFALFALIGSVCADGVPLTSGRYIGPVIVFPLASEQKKAIEHFRTCHLANFKTMNEFTPYVFRLTAGQAIELKAKVGFAPAYFDVYETYRGFNEAGPHWNLALRFSEDQIEIPIDLLLPDEKARQAHEEQGWKESNPCFPELRKK